jgi:hypothetical protein
MQLVYWAMPTPYPKLNTFTHNLTIFWITFQNAHIKEWWNNQFLLSDINLYLLNSCDSTSGLVSQSLLIEWFPYNYMIYITPKGFSSEILLFWSNVEKSTSFIGYCQVLIVTAYTRNWHPGRSVKTYHLTTLFSLVPKYCYLHWFILCEHWIYRFFFFLLPLTRELAPILEHRTDYSVSWSFIGGKTPWTSDQLVAGPLCKHRTTQTEKNADTH